MNEHMLVSAHMHGYQEMPLKDFPGGPVAKTLHSQSRGLSSIPGQGTRSHMLQLLVRVHMPQLKILHIATKTQSRQINTYIKKKKKEMLLRTSSELMSCEQTRE